MNNPNHMTPRQAIHAARVVLSFALLGAILAGVVFGGLDVDLRPYGAAAGGISAVVYKLLHVI